VAGVAAASETDLGIDGARAWRRLGFAVVAATIASVGMWSVILVLPAVQAEFGISRGAAALAYTATMLGFAAGNLALGRLVDRFGIGVVLAGAGLALAAAFALAAAASGIVVFALVQAVIGAASAAGFGPLIADVSHWFRRRRGIAVAMAASGNYLAGAVWPLALRGTLEAEGWRVAYLLVAAVCLMALPPLALALRRGPVNLGGAGGGPSGAMEPRLRSSGLSPRTLTLLLGLAGVGCCVAMSMPQVHIVAYCADLGYGVAVGAEMLAVMLGAGILSRLVSGLIADRIGGVRTLLIGSVLQALALALYLPFDGLASLYVVSLVFGLSQGGIVPSYALIVREYLPASEAGGRIGFVIMATILGMALGGWMSGAVFDLTGSYRLAFLNGIAWNLLNIAIMAGILLRGGMPPEAVARPA
jgi:MFS family permease